MREKTLSARTVFEGRLLRLEVVDVELEDGRQSVREIVRHPGAVAILPQLADGRFVLVRQYRKPLDESVLEVVAGTLHPGEDPRRCAVRELLEETGYEADGLQELGLIYPAPGYTDERLHVYHARLCGEPGAQATDEDEAVTVEILTREAIEAMIASGSLHDAKTLAAWALWRSRM